MRRHADGDWRTNVAQGGRAEAVTPADAEARLALRAAAAVGAPLAGVDLLPLPVSDGYCVLEVNAVPGWRALAPACSVDVATAIVRYLADEFAVAGVCDPGPASQRPATEEGTYRG
jgi:ribosomal protein S6--L-glutamate ligase